MGDIGSSGDPPNIDGQGAAQLSGLTRCTASMSSDSWLAAALELAVPEGDEPGERAGEAHVRLLCDSLLRCVLNRGTQIVL
jgi:hypothetical protein